MIISVFQLIIFLFLPDTFWGKKWIGTFIIKYYLNKTIIMALQIHGHFYLLSVFHKGMKEHAAGKSSHGEISGSTCRKDKIYII